MEPSVESTRPGAEAATQAAEPPRSSSSQPVEPSSYCPAFTVTTEKTDEAAPVPPEEPSRLSTSWT